MEKINTLGQYCPSNGLSVTRSTMVWSPSAAHQSLSVSFLSPETCKGTSMSRMPFYLPFEHILYRCENWYFGFSSRETAMELVCSTTCPFYKTIEQPSREKEGASMVLPVTMRQVKGNGWAQNWKATILLLPHKEWCSLFWTLYLRTFSVFSYRCNTSLCCWSFSTPRISSKTNHRNQAN